MDAGMIEGDEGMDQEQTESLTSQETSRELGEERHADGTNRVSPRLRIERQNIRYADTGFTQSIRTTPEYWRIRPKPSLPYPLTPLPFLLPPLPLAV